MEAIILAGGKGTRLQSVVSDVPKPMAPVNGKPFLEYVMSHLADSGMNRVILSVGYKHQCIMEYFKHEYCDMEIEYVVEEKPLGTGGAIKLALGKSNEDRVFILNGDTFFDVNYFKMRAFSEYAKSPLVMAVKEMENFDRYGSMDIQDGHVVAFKEKKFCSKGFINGGVYDVSRHLLDDFSDHIFSFEQDFLEPNYKVLNFPVYVSNGYFVDIGVPEDYQKADDYFRAAETKTMNEMG